MDYVALTSIAHRYISEMLDELHDFRILVMQVDTGDAADGNKYVMITYRDAELAKGTKLIQSTGLQAIAKDTMHPQIPIKNNLL